MNCPKCSKWTRVIDSRRSRDGNSIRRRRICGDCEHRFSTYEASADSFMNPVKDEGRACPIKSGKHSLHRVAPKRFVELVMPVLEFLQFHHPGILGEGHALFYKPQEVAAESDDSERQSQ